MILDLIAGLHWLPLLIVGLLVFLIIYLIERKAGHLGRHGRRSGRRNNRNGTGRRGDSRKRGNKP